MKQNIVQFILIYIFSIITLLFLSIIVNFVSISIFLSEAVFSYENIFIFVFTNSIIFFFLKKIFVNKFAELLFIIFSIFLSYIFIFNFSLNISNLIIFITTILIFNYLIMSYFDKKTFNKFFFEQSFLKFLKTTGLIFFSFIIIFPFYLMFVSSLKSQMTLMQYPTNLSIPFTFSISDFFSSYIAVITEYNFLTFALNSTIVSFVTVLISLLFSIPGAYAVARLRFKGRTQLSSSILLVYMVPAIVLVIPLYVIFSQLGFRNSLFSLMIVYPATTIPVALYMFQGYFKGIPYELEEAGLIDGCSRISVILKITLPLSIPAILSVSLYVFMIAWNEFLFAFMFLDNQEYFTLPRGLYTQLDDQEVPRQYLMAGSVMITLPVLFLFFLFERYLVGGLTAGSVKG
jgi:multiple sugar transport system permease protein|tara:strand:+ start:2676 stop:3881 length:1206 start_codon:yes stop_codon:yes gene_type:complete